MDFEPTPPNLKLLSQKDFHLLADPDELEIFCQSKKCADAILDDIWGNKYKHKQDFMMFTANSETELFIQYYLRFITAQLAWEDFREKCQKQSLELVDEPDGQEESIAAMTNQAIIDSEEMMASQLWGLEILKEELGKVLTQKFHTFIKGKTLTYPANVYLHTFFDPEYNPQLK